MSSSPATGIANGSAHPVRPTTRTRILPDDKLTLVQLCDELQIARSTFYDWRAKGRGPRCIRLPNGDLRIRRRDLDSWLAEHEEPYHDG